MVNKDPENDEPQKLRYPRSVFFIIVNEFCERFSYYGMKTVLTLYLRDILGFNEDQSTVWYHAFAMLCYFTPVFGAILADTYLGKFKTILYLSILYACGNILLSVASIPNTIPQTEFSLLGLFVIAVGTGGIKPCVSAFGGDQFVRPQQDLQLEQFFSVFYFAINAGSLISTFVTPYLRETVHCFGDQSCYPLAFGVPAVLMITALAVFVFGKRSYKVRPAEGNVMVDFAKCVTRCYKTKRPEGNVMLAVGKCVAHAIARKIKSKGEEHDHWLDFASDKFDKQLIKDIKQVFRVFVLYLPIPIFWALFDQQGSRWTFQATRMDGTIGSATILPDQMQIVNPLFILALVPVFESLIYPCFRKCGLLTPLQRIGAGGVIAGLAFVISGFVELSLEPTYAKIPSEGRTQFNFINTLPCQVNVSYMQTNLTLRWTEMNATSYAFERDLEDKPYPVKAQLVDPLCGPINFTTTEWTGILQGASKKAYSVVITNRNGKLEVVRMDRPEPLQKTSSGRPRVQFVFNMNEDAYSHGNITIREVSSNAEKSFAFRTSPLTSTMNRLVNTDDHDIAPGTYAIFVPHMDGNENRDEPAGSTITLKQGGCYTVLIQRPLHVPSAAHHEDDLVVFIEVTPPNTVHMLWLVPQFFIMTIAEVMFSVTGLTFSFTQAPASMKSVMQAAWLLTIAFGNLIVLIVAEINGIPRQSMEFFLFAGLMGLDMLLFFFLAARYEYVDAEKKDDAKPPIDQKPTAVQNSKQQESEMYENKGFTDTSM